MSLESIINDLERTTAKIYSIKKRFDVMQDDAKISEMVEDQQMIEYSRMKSELKDVQHQLKREKKANQGGDVMNLIIGEQQKEIDILYSVLKEYHISVKDGWNLAFQHRLNDAQACKFKKLMGKSIDTASHEVVMRLCANCELSSCKAVDCAKFFRENTCEQLPLPLFQDDDELMQECMNSADNK